MPSSNALRSSNPRACFSASDDKSSKLVKKGGSGVAIDWNRLKELYGRVLEEEKDLSNQKVCICPGAW